MSLKNNISALLLVVCAILMGCIENDIPYAKVPLVISQFEVEGQKGNATIDKKTQRVNVVLHENINPKAVKVKNITYFAEYEGDTAYYKREEVRSSLNTDIIDLSDTLNITLSLYQDYLWVIDAEQPIERYFVVDGQVINSDFDVKNKVATAYISKAAYAQNFVLKSLKLGPVGAAYNGFQNTLPQFDWKRFTNYSETKVNVSFSDFFNEIWTLRILPKDLSVQTLQPHAWVKVAWLYGAGAPDKDFLFEYREQGSEDWITVAQNLVKKDGSTFSARLGGLKESTTYEYRACSGGNYADPVTFTTEAPQVVPNMGFEEWSEEKGKIVCPWTKITDRYWDCGNWGSNTVGKNNITNPDSDIRPGSAGKNSAKLETKSVFGVLATGNLFVGMYKETKGLNGLLGFGRPFTTYPTRLTGYYKYKSEKISEKTSESSKGFDFLANTQDSCFIYIALGDWEQDDKGTYVKILTDKGNNKGTYFDVNDPHIIAYGSMSDSKTTTEYAKFDIKLDYRTLERRPTAIIIVCAASKYGDYFVGGVGSTLWIDDFNLEYD